MFQRPVKLDLLRTTLDLDAYDCLVAQHIVPVVLFQVDVFGQAY